MTQLLVIPGELPSLNQVIASSKQRRKSKGKWVPGAPYAELKRIHTMSVWALARAAKLKPVKRPVILHFLWVRDDKRTDPDNVSGGGRKSVLDGLVEAGVLPRDSWQWIKGFTDEFAVDRDNPRTEVWIVEAE